MTDKKKTADESKAAPSAAQPSRTRHSKPARKPVTIEAKATRKSDKTPETETKSAAAKAQPAAAEASAPRTSVPKSTKTSATLNKPDPVKPETETKAKPANGFRRDASKGQSKATPSAPPTPKPETKSAASGRDETKQPKRASTGGLILAGLIGGGVALAGAAALQYAGIVGSPGGAQRVAALEESLAAYRTETSERFSAVEDTVADLPQTASGGLSEQDVRRLIEENATDPSAAGATALEERVAALEAQGPSATDGAASSPAASDGLRQSLEALSTRLDQLERGAGEAGSNAAQPQSDDAAIAALRQELAQRIENLETRFTTDLGNARETAQQTAQQVSALAETATETAATVQSNSADLAALKERLESGADRKAAAAIAAAALKNEIDSGRDFADALTNLRRFAPELDGLEGLESYAQSGIPTVTALKRRFDSEVSETIRNSLASSDTGEESFSDRLLSATQSLVTVKPIGPVEGDTPAALMSQISASLEADDPAAAETAWTKLPAEARQASADWQRDLHARVVANTVIAGALQSLMTIEQDG